MFQVRISGRQVHGSQSSALEKLGYCPQHDCIWPNLTIQEHLECFAEIRGIERNKVKIFVEALITGLKLKDHANKMTSQCSGGTNRKLSFALSMLGKCLFKPHFFFSDLNLKTLLGSPDIVLLDEPSTGMDPYTKRFLWNWILASFKV